MQLPSLAVAVAVDDARTREALDRLAALAGVSAHPVAGPAALRSRWPAAVGVVVDVSAARSCLDAGLARRDGVLLLVPGEPTDDAWRLAVALGAENVLTLPSDERRVLDWMAAVGQPAAQARVICCVPARGGCGSSTLAAALALAGGDRGLETLLLDVDPRAGGVELLLGIEHLGGSRWDEFAAASGVLTVADLADALPRVGRVRVLSCERGSRRALPVPAVEAVLAAARRGHALVVTDSSNVTDGVTSVVTAAADTVVVTVAAEVAAVAAATTLVAQLGESSGDIRLVVRHPGPGGLRPRDVSDAVGAPVAAVWPRDRKLARTVEHGRFARGWQHSTVAAVTTVLLDALGGGLA